MSDSTTRTTITIADHAFALGPDALQRSERERERIESEVRELEALGVRVAQLVLGEDGSPPRYEFTYPPGLPHFETRLKLERAGFDVGQHLGAGELCFYASRRVETSDGWSV